MRALFTCLPGYGDFFPLVPYGRALETAGHHVAFVTHADFLPVVERAGFDAFAGGAHILIDEGLAELRASWTTPLDQILHIYTLSLCNYLPERMIPDLLRIAEAWQPDIIIREWLEFGGCVAAELMDIPHAVAGPMEFYPEHVERAFQPALDDLRQKFGLPSDPKGLMSHRYLTLAGLPPVWPGERELVPPVTHFIRPDQFDDLDGVSLPNWIADLPDRPTVHVSMGTVANTAPGNYETIVKGLRDEDLNLIVALGTDRDASEFGPQPENVHFVPFIPHSLVLPHCDLMISHAGYGGTMACLLNGVPAVMLPVFGDQFRNAHRFASLGAGIALNPAQRTPGNVRDAVLAILHDPRYRQHARDLQRQLQALPGLDHAIWLLEQLVAEKQPIPAA